MEQKIPAKRCVKIKMPMIKRELTKEEKRLVESLLKPLATLKHRAYPGK